MDIKKAAGNIPVLQSANPASLAALLPYGSVKRFKRGSHLFMDKSDMRHVFFLAEGVAVLYKLNRSQDKKVIFVCGTGTMLNEELLDGKPTSVYCELLTDSWVLSFERQRFLYVCGQDFELAKAVMDAMALKIRRLYRQMRNSVGTVRMDKKLAAKLWKLSRDYGVQCDQGTRIGFSLSVTFLAELIGTKRETVSRQLKLLTQKGLVIICKNSFIIPDRDNLKKYFDEA